MATQKIQLDEIEKLLSLAAQKFISKEEADYFAREQVECTLRMYPDVNPVKNAVNDLISWNTHPNIKPVVITDKPASLFMDFNKLSPTPKIKFIHDQLEKRAKLEGLALFGFNNSAIPNWLKLFTHGLAKRNLIGLFIESGGSEAVVPYGGSIPMLGTNPLSYAIPTEDDPILVDMSTAASAFYKFKRARNAKTPVADNVIVDKAGNPTNDPEEAYMTEDTARIRPMGGGYKGYNLVFLIEVLTGALLRSKMGLTKSSDYTPTEYGGLLIAIDIASLTDISLFKHEVSEMVTSIRNQAPANYADKVRVPGDSSLARAKKLRTQGFIEVDTEVMDKLNQMLSQNG